MIDANPNYIKNIQNHIYNAFPSAVLSDFHQNLLHYQIKDTELKCLSSLKQWEKLNVIIILKII